MKLATLSCSECGTAYVWRVAFSTAERRFEWRPAQDCECKDGHGTPQAPEHIRAAYVRDDEGGHIVDE